MLVLDKYDRLVRRMLGLVGARSRYRVVAGERVHYYEVEGSGTGPPLVLVHGLGGNANSFAAILSGLRRRWRRVFVPDLPGHGFSPLDSGRPPLDLRGHGALIHAFIVGVIQEPVVLVGNSMGGALSLGLTVEKPEDVLALGLLAPAGAPLTPQDIATLRANFTPTTRAEAVAFIDRLTHRPMYAARLAASDIREMIRSPAIQHILAQATPEERLDAEKVRALRQPTLLVWGVSEKVLPAGGIDYFRATLPPHARIEILERCGHLPMMEQPERTIRLLNELGREAVGTSSSR